MSTPQPAPPPLIDPDSALAAALVASALWMAIGVYDTLLIEFQRSTMSAANAASYIGPLPRLLKHLLLLPAVLAALWRLARYAQHKLPRARVVSALIVFALGIGLLERLVLNTVGLLTQPDSGPSMTPLGWLGYWTSSQGTYVWFRSAMQGSASFLIVVLAMAARSAARRALATQGEINRVQVAQLNARLAALENELSPHFLFNSLHFAVARTHEAATRTMLVDISDLLRYVLRGRAEPKVTLQEEVEFSTDYLELCEQQGARVAVRWQVAEAARHARLPRMLLHMLIENAYRHAAEVESGATIAVVASVVGDRLELTISNDFRPGAAITGTGIGLSNARERLRILFGARAQLEAGPSAAGTWRTTVALPLELAA